MCQQQNSSTLPFSIGSMFEHGINFLLYVKRPPTQHRQGLSKYSTRIIGASLAIC